jgi:NAD(P)-dependent dehydrogenase (short-subunit alcohol dehydrogenase family)
MSMPPDFRLDGKVALVTGAGRGIGLGIAEALAGVGCAVAIQDIELDVARNAAAEIGGRAVALGGDMGDLAVVEGLVPETVKRFGGLQILVNNAAVQSERPWPEMSPAEVERIWRVNGVAVLRLCQLAVPEMRRGSYGRIINVGSIQQRKGTPTMLPYSMSKAALENLTTGLARDLAGEGITVNLIAPGYFDTYRNREEMDTPEKRSRAGRFVPMGRVGTPEDCAGVAVLLASPAGSYITGQSIFVDGGMSVK